ncbi:MAG: hypothetical protein LBN97_02040 [Oscillospiraceae bacterium]|jgi:Na+-driven multidrug efflux pump|nr:hypothetical protein [Oscillospiraceae bacterium]
MKQGDAFIKQAYGRHLLSTLLALTGSAAGSIVNSVLMGRLLGADLLSVPCIVIPLHYIFASAGALIGVGGMAACANLIGEKDPDRCNKAFTVTWLMTLAVAAVLTAILLPNLDLVVRLLGAPPEIYGNVRSYAAVLIISGVFNMGVYPVFNLLRLDGKMVASVIVFAVMAVATAVLDLLLIGKFGLGAAGASIAVYGGLAAAAIFGAALLIFSGENMKLVRVKAAECWQLAKKILFIGTPSAIENVCILLKTYALNALILGGFGVIAVSAFQVVNSVNSFAVIFTAGVSGAIMSFCGVFSTERDTVSIRQLLKLAFIEGAVLIAAVTVVCVLIPESISRLFGIDGDALKLSASAVTIFAVSFLPSMVNNILICLYQSTGREWLANVMTVLRGFLFVAGFALLLSGVLGISGIWHSFWLAELLTLIIALILGEIIRRKNPYISRLLLLDTTIESEGHSIALSVKDTDEEIAASAALISEFCEANDISPKRTNAISLAAEEMLVLIKAHTTVGNTASLRVTTIQGVVVLRIRNFGGVYNPLSEYDDDDMDFLGLKLVKNMAEIISYQRTFGANNLTVIL